MKLKLILVTVSVIFTLVQAQTPEEEVYNSFLMGEYYQFTNDNEKAEYYYLLVLEENPESITIYKTLTDFYLDIKDYDNAVIILIQAINIFPDNNEFITTLLNIYIYQDQTEKIKSLLEDQILIHPNNVDLKLKLASFYYSENKWIEIIKLYSDVYIIDNSRSDVIQTMIELRIQSHEYDALINGFKKLIDYNPINPEIIITYFQLLYIVGDNDQVLTELLLLNQKYPNNIYVNNQIGQHYNDHSDFAKSDSVYISLIESDNHNVTTLNNYAYNISIRENSGIKMLQTALDYASLALDQDPENASFLDTVGWIYYKMEKNELAEYFIIQSLKYNDSNPIIFEHLGDIYVSMNNMMNAISAYENAIEIDSQNEIIQKKIEKIKIND